jgi:DNA-binding MarR family transcriptional regulator
MKGAEDIFFQIAKANQAAVRFWGKRITKFKVTVVQGMILYSLIKEENGITSKGLGEKTLLDSATLTGVLDRLETGGLTERKPNPGDRRAILIYLTEKGKDVAAKIKEAGIQANKDFLKELSQEDENKLREMLLFIRQKLA